jgi:hypothetical protein
MSQFPSSTFTFSARRMLAPSESSSTQVHDHATAGNNILLPIRLSPSLLIQVARDAPPANALVEESPFIYTMVAPDTF